MRIDRSLPQAAHASRAQHSEHTQSRQHAEKAEHKEHTPRGKAHGVVRKLGTGHFNPTAEARLMAHFGHLLKANEPEVPTETPEEIVDEGTDPTTVEPAAQDPVATDAPAVEPEVVADETPREVPITGAIMNSQFDTIDAAAEQEEEVEEPAEQVAAFVAEPKQEQTPTNSPITASFTYNINGTTIMTNFLIGQTIDLIG